MKKSLFILVVIISFLSCKNPKENVSVDFGKEEWISLFNGKDLSNWDIKIANYELGDNYKNTFKAEDNMIRVVYDEYKVFNNAFGHLYYKTPFSYYKLKLDYRFTGNQVAGGASWAKRNSGIMLHSQSAESNSIGQYFPVSIEMQFLGGLGQQDRPTGNLCTPGTAVKMNDSINYDHCINSSSKTFNGDQWVHVEAVVLGDEKIIHIIENDTVIVYYKPVIGGGLITKGVDKEWKENGIDNQETWLAKDGEPLKKGYLALQAESHSVDFKNIELLDLCGCMDKKAQNYKSYYLKADNTKCVYD